ncbi:hypothetical protein FBU30_010035 [Linnemannia zychae]|nr:hypothetical protein FBU30_010035 [Linnemannia zychae]
MDTNTVSVSTPPSNKQLRNDYVTAWLNHQAMDDDHCYRFDTNQIEDDQYTTFPEQQESQLNILPHQNANTTSPSRISYHHHLPQANHSSATIMRAFLAQGHGNGHRRCLSLTNPMTMSVTPTQTISYEEQLRQQLEWRRQNYQLLHANTATTTLSTAAISSRYPDTHLFSDGLVSYWPPQKTAEELAWERHNYYLRLQVEEEELIEKLQSDRKQGRGHRAQHKKLNQLWKPQPEPSPSVARTSSLNRLSGPSLLSAETSRVLGLCRTSTLSAVKKISFSKKDTFSRTSRPASPSFGYSSKSASNVVDDDSILTQGLEVYSYGHTTITTSNMTTGTTSSSPSLSLGTSSSSSSPPSKNLIKDHLGPSLKSLARRCSTRFYRRSRSNSDAYPTSDITDDYPLGRRSLGSYPSQQKQRSHLYDFKQVPTGPTSGSTELPMQEGRHRRSMTNERVPIHRTVTMTRSKSTRTPTSATMAKKDNGHHPAPISTVLELPYRPHRNSLRFANGRGLEFSRTPSLTTASSSSSQSTRSSVDLKGSAVTPGHNDEKGLIPIITTTLVDADSSIVISSVVPTSVLDPEEHESMRQQIVAILSLDRNDMRRRPSSRPRSRSATPGLDRPQQTDQHIDQHQQEHLSPLAVEAQDILPVDPKTTQKEQEVAAELADPCGHIAFMLVPKSQYEFQPLVAH